MTSSQKLKETPLEVEKYQTMVFLVRREFALKYLS